MKKTILIPFILLISILFLPSCLFQEEDVFPKSASERVDEAMAELKELLMSSPGWRTTYFTDSTYFGGYNIIMRFDDKKVYVQGDNAFESGIHLGYYTFNSSQGVVLDFNTYNEVFGYLADPGKNITGLGLGGDNEFVWAGKSQNEDTVYFRAKKNGTEVNFIRYEENWDDYFNKVDNMYKRFNSDEMNKYFKIIYFDDGTNLLFSGYDEIFRTLNPTYIVNGDSVVTMQNGVAFTETGIDFFKPITYDGKTFQYLVYDDASRRFIVTADNGVTGYLAAINEPPLPFIFPGELSNYIFANGKNYRLTGIPNEIGELFSEMAKQVPNFYSLSFISNGGGSDYIIAVTVRKGQNPIDFAYLCSWGKSVNVNNRSDKFRFYTSNRITIINGFEEDTEEYELYENSRSNFEGPFTNFIKALFPTGTAFTGGEAYIAIPDGLYRNFTFGSTESNKYFRISLM